MQLLTLLFLAHWDTDWYPLGEHQIVVCFCKNTTTVNATNKNISLNINLRKRYEKPHFKKK